MTRSARLMLTGLLLCGATTSAASARVALRWKIVEGATSYEVQIARDPAFQDVVVDEKSKVAGYRWGELPNVAYFWRVRSFDKDGRSSDWSRAQRIDPAVGRPEPKEPANGFRVILGGASADVVLTAVPSPVFRTYSFEVSRDPSFAQPQTYPSGPDAQVRVRVDATGPWFWRVRAVDLSERPSEPSEPRTFQVEEGPPAPDVSRSTAELVWSQPPPAATLHWSSRRPFPGYTVEITWEKHGRQSLEAASSGLSFVPSGPGLYRWRVRGTDAQGKPTPFGDAATLKVGLAAPELHAPDENARVALKDGSAEVSFEWAVPVGASSVRWELASDAAFSRVLEARELQGEKASVPITQRGQVFWRLTALDATGNVSPPTAARSLRLETAIAPAVPEPLLPAADAIVPLAPDGRGVVSFQWKAVPGALKYQVLVDDEPAGSLERMSQSQTLEAATLAPGEHSWRVRAFGEQGLSSAFCAPVRFDLGPPLPVKARIEVASPQLPANGRASTELHITLFDAKGRPISGARPVVSSNVGEVRSASTSEEGYRIRYVSPAEVPESGEAQVVVADRGFRSSTPIRLVESTSRVMVGARLGWNGVLSQLSSPRLELEAQWRSPWLRRRLWLGGRVSGYQGSGKVAVEQVHGPVEWSTQVVPVAATAVYRLPLRWFDVYGGGLLSLNAVRFTQSDRGAEWVLSPGLGAVAGAAWRVGPGSVSVELGASITTARGELSEGRVGGMFFTVGYGVEL